MDGQLTFGLLVNFGQCSVIFPIRMIMFPKYKIYIILSDVTFDAWCTINEENQKKKTKVIKAVKDWNVSVSERPLNCSIKKNFVH